MALKGLKIPSIFPTSSASDEGINTQKTKEGVLTLVGTDFYPESEGYSYEYENADPRLKINTIANNELVVAPVHLPKGATITSVKCTGSNSNATWLLRRRKIDLSAVAQTIATAKVNTEDTSVTFGLIDEDIFGYAISIEVQNTNTIYGCRIEYVF